MISKADIENAIVDQRYDQYDRCVLTLRNGVTVTGRPTSRRGLHQLIALQSTRRQEALQDARRQVPLLLMAIFTDRTSSDPLVFEAEAAQTVPLTVNLHTVDPYELRRMIDTQIAETLAKAQRTGGPLHNQPPRRR